MYRNRCFNMKLLREGWITRNDFEEVELVIKMSGKLVSSCIDSKQLEVKQIDSKLN